MRKFKPIKRNDHKELRRLFGTLMFKRFQRETSGWNQDGNIVDRFAIRILRRNADMDDVNRWDDIRHELRNPPR